MSREVRAAKRHWWPDTLAGRLVVILVVGMFAGQVFTGTIWFQSRDNRTLEVPARVLASRLADTVRLLDGAPDERARQDVVRQLADTRYQLRWVGAPVTVPEHSLALDAIGHLLSGVMRQRLREPVEVNLIDAQLRDEAGMQRGILSLFDSRMPSGDFHVQIRLPQGAWLDVVATEDQSGVPSEPHALVFDYLLRIYAIRFAAVLLVALIAVRFAVQPLRQLAKAAEALGNDMHRPPLRIDGPREVRMAAQAFNAMQRQLIESIGARMRFLAAVSHDLRSPLTRLRLRAEMLPDAQWRERLRSDLDEMDAMVRATLDFVQGVEITETRLHIDIDSMLRGLRDDASEAGARVEIAGHALRPVAGYPRNLKRCLQNLLDNAVRYGGGAWVRVEDDGRVLRISVRDEGPGIADEALLERVFEPYFRVAASRGTTTGEDGGTGLGLTIARSIATAHGGTLVLRNRSDKGLEAILTLSRQ